MGLPLGRGATPEKCPDEARDVACIVAALEVSTYRGRVQRCDAMPSGVCAPARWAQALKFEAVGLAPRAELVTIRRHGCRHACDAMLLALLGASLEVAAGRHVVRAVILASLGVSRSAQER